MAERQTDTPGRPAKLALFSVLIVYEIEKKPPRNFSPLPPPKNNIYIYIIYIYTYLYLYYISSPSHRCHDDTQVRHRRADGGFSIHHGMFPEEDNLSRCRGDHLQLHDRRAAHPHDWGRLRHLYNAWQKKKDFQYHTVIGGTRPNNTMQVYNNREAGLEST